MTYDKASARYSTRVDDKIEAFASMVEILRLAKLNVDPGAPRSVHKQKPSRHYASGAAEFLFADANKHSRHYEVLTAAEAGYDIVAD